MYLCAIIILLLLEKAWMTHAQPQTKARSHTVGRQNKAVDNQAMFTGRRYLAIFPLDFISERPRSRQKNLPLFFPQT